MLEDETYYISNHTGLRPAAIALGAAQPNRNGVSMYIEVTDTIAIVIALTLSTTLVITTAIKNAQLTRKLRELKK